QDIAPPIVPEFFPFAAGSLQRNNGSHPEFRHFFQYPFVAAAVFGKCHTHVQPCASLLVCMHIAYMHNALPLLRTTDRGGGMSPLTIGQLDDVALLHTQHLHYMLCSVFV